MRRRGKQIRRARTVVFNAVGLFALSQLLLAWAAETILPELRDPSAGIRWRLFTQRWSEAGRSPDFVFFGSSRIETGIQPAAFVPLNSDRWSFNLGQPGGGPIQQWLAVRRMTENGVRPQVAVIEVMPALLVDSRPVEHCVHADRLSWRDIVDLWPDCTDGTSLLRAWLAARAAPVYSSRFLILSRWIPTWLPIANRTDYLWADMDRWGGQRLPATVESPAERQRGWEQAQAEYAQRLRHFQISPSHAAFLRRTLDECRRREAAPVLLLMPESEAFRAMYSVPAQMEVQRLLAELSAPVLDARSWLDEGAFYDGHHLLPAGAATLSARLRVELASLFDLR